MWFEIIPSFAIITVALAVPGVVKFFGHQLIFGNVSNTRCFGNANCLKGITDMRLTNVNVTNECHIIFSFVLYSSNSLV
jgi:hypothetical protein